MGMCRAGSMPRFELTIENSIYTQDITLLKLISDVYKLAFRIIVADLLSYYSKPDYISRKPPKFKWGRQNPRLIALR